MPYHGTRPSFLTVVLEPTAEQGLHSCCLGKHSQTETGFKMNFLPMKGENFITSCCVILTIKSAKIQWLGKEILVLWSIGHRLFPDDDSMHKVDDLDDGWCFILNKYGWRRVKLCQSDHNTAMLAVEMWALLSGFSCPILTLRPLSPILLELGEVTCSELLSTKGF